MSKSIRMLKQRWHTGKQVYKRVFGQIEEEKTGFRRTPSRHPHPHTHYHQPHHTALSHAHLPLYTAFWTTASLPLGEEEILGGLKTAWGASQYRHPPWAHRPIQAPKGVPQRTDRNGKQPSRARPGRRTVGKKNVCFVYALRLRCFISVASLSARANPDPTDFISSKAPCRPHIDRWTDILSYAAEGLKQRHLKKT